MLLAATSTVAAAAVVVAVSQAGLAATTFAPGEQVVSLMAAG